MTTNKSIPNITMTVIFEGSALNRNEKIGGNILSVKKLNVNGEEKTYLSKGAIRHYLFNTLIRAYNWKEAKIDKDKDVLQFNITEDDILTCEELDVFGYMNTTKGQTRKTPLHITKAISLFPYEQDMGLYANHDLVRRANEQGNMETSNPNPFNKEEHTSFYKVTFTIDSDKLGVDKWIVPKVEIDKENNLILLKGIPQKEEKEADTSTDTADNSQKNKKDRKEQKEEILRSLLIKGDPDPEKNIFEVENGLIEFGQLQNNKYWITFELTSAEKTKRIGAILNTIHNGLIAHTSSESNTIVPIFTIIGDVTVPSPVFHSFIDVKKNNEGTFEVIGVKDALNNGWLKGHVFISGCDHLKVKVPVNIENSKTWEDFLCAVCLSKSNEDESSEN